MAEQREYHLMVDQDDDGDLVFKMTKPSGILDMIVDAGHIGRWSFPCSLGPGNEFVVFVYNGFGPDIPQGENLEEMNRRAVECVLRSD